MMQSIEKTTGSNWLTELFKLQPVLSGEGVEYLIYKMTYLASQCHLLVVIKVYTHFTEIHFPQ